MIFNTELDNLIFNKHKEIDCDEFTVISGYLGLSAVERVKELPLKANIVYGMFNGPVLNNNRALNRKNLKLSELNDSITNLDIYYSKNFQVHSKCYIWKKGGIPKYALAGSANFSDSGLRNPYKETLVKIEDNLLGKIIEYEEIIFNNALKWDDLDFEYIEDDILEDDLTDCFLSWLDSRTGLTHNAHGVNWGQNLKNHTNADDACIPINMSHIKKFPDLFPPKSEHSENFSSEGRIQRHNDPIEMLWDDGEIMRGLLEGVNVYQDRKYPKQISSFPNKNILGRYIRKRLGLESGVKVLKEDFINMLGRTDIKISKTDSGTYFMDMSKIN